MPGTWLYSVDVKGKDVTSTLKLPAVHYIKQILDQHLLVKFSIEIKAYLFSIYSLCFLCADLVLGCGNTLMNKTDKTLSFCLPRMTYSTQSGKQWILLCSLQYSPALSTVPGT